MRQQEFEKYLQEHDFMLADIEGVPINVYITYMSGRTYAIGAFNFDEGVVTNQDLWTAKERLKQEMGVTDMHFIIFSNFPLQAQEAFAEDNTHWVYSETRGALAIFEGQPTTFMNLRNILETNPVFSGEVNSERLIQDAVINKKKKKDPDEITPLSYILSVNTWIVILNIAIFFYQQYYGNTEHGLYLISKGSLYTPKVYEEGEWWRVFTSMFMHAGTYHLVGNMACLLIIGYKLERTMGLLWYSVLYLGSGLIGNFLSMIVYAMAGDTLNAVGASGAIFGVVGGLVWYLIFDKRKQARWFFAWIILYFGNSLYQGFKSEGVCNSAHIGGLIGGVLLAWGIYAFRLHRLKRAK